MRGAEDGRKAWLCYGEGKGGGEGEAGEAGEGKGEGEAVRNGARPAACLFQVCMSMVIHVTCINESLHQKVHVIRSSPRLRKAQRCSHEHKI